jgi:hypothetical protein
LPELEEKAMKLGTPVVALICVFGAVASASAQGITQDTLVVSGSFSVPEAGTAIMQMSCPDNFTPDVVNIFSEFDRVHGEFVAAPIDKTVSIRLTDTPPSFAGPRGQVEALLNLVCKRSLDLTQDTIEVHPTIFVRGHVIQQMSCPDNFTPDGVKIFRGTERFHAEFMGAPVGKAVSIRVTDTGGIFDGEIHIVTLTLICKRGQ